MMTDRNEEALKTLIQLRDAGVLTDEEFQKKKAQLFSPKEEKNVKIKEALKTLIQLRDAGIITEEEFQKKKEQIESNKEPKEPKEKEFPKKEEKNEKTLKTLIQLRENGIISEEEFQKKKELLEPKKEFLEPIKLVDPKKEEALKTLIQLRDAGVISEEEFQKKKSQIFPNLETITQPTKLPKKEHHLDSISDKPSKESPKLEEQNLDVPKTEPVDPKIEEALRTLIQLRDAGVITEEEFQKKKELLEPKVENLEPKKEIKKPKTEEPKKEETINDEDPISTLNSLRDAGLISPEEYEEKLNQIKASQQSQPREIDESQEEELKKPHELTIEDRKTLNTLAKLLDKKIITEEEYYLKRKQVYSKKNENAPRHYEVKPKRDSSGFWKPQMSEEKKYDIPTNERRFYSKKQIEDAKMELTLAEKIKLGKLRDQLRRKEISEETYEELRHELMCEFLTLRELKKEAMEKAKAERREQRRKMVELEKKKAEEERMMRLKAIEEMSKSKI